MLPFLKHKDDGVGVGPVEVKEREHDDSYDALDAVAEDILQAIEKKDKVLLKSALKAFQELDEELDEQLLGGQK